MKSFTSFTSLKLTRSGLLRGLMVAVTATLLACGGGGTIPYPGVQLRALPADFSTRLAVAYSPYRAGGPNVGEVSSVANIQQDLALLHQGGFGLLRLYDCSSQNKVAENVLSVLTNNPSLNMKVQLGAYLAPNPGTTPANETANQTQLQTCIALANQYPNLVAAVSVGNENLDSWSGAPVAVADLVRYIKQVRAAVPQPVTYDENFATYANVSTALLNVIDFASIHSYAIIDSVYASGSWDWQQTGVTPSQSGSSANTRATAMMDAALHYTQANFTTVKNYFTSAGYPNLPITIGETGWKAVATGGEVQRASPVNALMFWTRLQGWMSGSAAKPVNIFYFEAFDEAWKGGDDGWGLFNANRQARCAALSLFNYPSAEQTSAQCALSNAVYYIPTTSGSAVTAANYEVFRSNIFTTPATVLANSANPSALPVWNAWQSGATAVGSVLNSGCATTGTNPDANFCIQITPTPLSWGWGMALTLPNSSDNLSNFSNGHLNFSVKTTYSGKVLVGFMTGATNGTGAQQLYQVLMPLSPGSYGYANSGQWVNVSIPISALIPSGVPASGSTNSAALQMGMVSQPFVMADIFGTTGNSTSSASAITVGNVYWTQN